MIRMANDSSLLGVLWIELMYCHYIIIKYYHQALYTIKYLQLYITILIMFYHPLNYHYSPSLLYNHDTKPDDYISWRQERHVNNLIHSASPIKHQ